jgi:undecaprenyl-diphosphatase
MSVIESLILGLIQGLTEFLPVSSSGHLELAKALLGSEALPKESLLVTVILHFATALSTLFLFRKDVWAIIQKTLSKDSSSITFTFSIVLSMLPAAAVGFFFEDLIDSFFSGNLTLVGMMLILTALLLVIADRSKASQKSLNYRDAFLIGIAQAIAILPGISRSGATISTSVILGLDKSEAARFSFLMVVPLIFGKIAKDLLSGSIFSTEIETVPLIIGFLSAFSSGIIACKWMITLVKKSRLTYFAVYCVIAGVSALIFL